MKKPFISVVVPAYNEEKYIESNLVSLKNQDYPKKSFEVIVEVSGSVDNTAKIAKKYGAKVVDVGKRLGVSGARHTASLAASGDIIAGTDADTMLPAHWLRVISENLGHDKYSGVTGPVRAHAKRFWPKFSYAFSYELYYLIGLAHFGDVYFPGMNFAIKKSVFDKIGGFDTTLSAGEDLDLSVKALKHGKIKFDRRMTAYTKPRRLKEGSLRGYFRYTRTFIAVKYRLGTAPGFADYR